MSSFHVADCRSCGKAYNAPFTPNPTGLEICAACERAHDVAMRTQDIILPCYTCGEDVRFSVVMAATGLTRIAAVFCSERCSDIDCEHNCDDLRAMESEHDEEEEVAHVRTPFVADEGMAEFYAEYDAEILTCTTVCARCEQKFDYLERRGRLHEGGPDLCKACVAATAPQEALDDDCPF